jgi:hypothetical protein
MSSGGGGSTSSTVYQNAIPEWAQPYATKVLGEAEALTLGSPGGEKPTYKQYGGERLAGLNDVQTAGLLGTMGLGPSYQSINAPNVAMMAGEEASRLGRSYAPMQYNPMGLSYLQANVNPLQQYQMGPAQQVTADQFNTQAMQNYMSPYMAGVIGQQKQAAIQDYARQIPSMQAASIRSGARGGTRESLLQAEARRGLMGQLGGIEASGRQQAYQQAAQQFGADRAAAMQAQLANQQAGLTTGQQNLAALLGTQQLGTQAGLQAALANQQAQLQAQQQGLTQNQAAQQAMEQSRQFGAGLGLQGLQQQVAAAQAAGGLGQQAFTQQLQALEAQQKAGSQMQGLEQQRLDQMYQDFLTQQRYPYAQLGFLSDMLRGVPSATASQTLYQAPPSPMSSVAGIGSLIYGLQQGK